MAEVNSLLKLKELTAQLTSEKQKKDLLIVDNNESVTSTLDRVLSGYYNVKISGSLQNACENLQVHKFDILLLDIHSPNGSGMDLIPKVKEIWPSTKILIMSGYPSLEDQATAMEQGVIGWLDKPLNLDMLIRRLTCADGG